MNNYSIIVDCPDEYLDILRVFFFFVDKNWKNRTQRIFITSQNEEIEHPDNVEFVKCGLGNNSIQRTKKALEIIDTKYVLIIQCDDFIGKPIDEKKIADMLQFADRNGYVYVRVWETKNCEQRKYKTGFKDLYFCNKKARYSKCLMANFWDKNEYLKLFSDDKTDGWNVEGQWLKDTLTETKGYFKDYCYFAKNPFNIVHAVSKGKWLKKAYKFALKNGVDKKMLSNREILPFKSSLKFTISMFLYDHLPSSIFYLIKKIFRNSKNYTTKY